MTDMMARLHRAVPVVFLALVALAGCGSSTSPAPANDHLDSAYDSYMSGNMMVALDEVAASIAAEPLREAALLKPQIEFAMVQPEVAFASLDAFAASNLGDGGDDVLRAEFLAGRSGSCVEILGNLTTAASQQYGGLTCETFWEMVEGYRGFSYFRDTCPAEYASLEASKVACPAEAEGARSCKQNINKFVYQKALGPELWLNHATVWLDGQGHRRRDQARVVAGEEGGQQEPLWRGRALDLGQLQPRLGSHGDLSVLGDGPELSRKGARPTRRS
jgi:hypothetical protein